MARPLRPEPNPEVVQHVRRLVSVSEGDPLAPFALRPDKRYVFSPDGRAAVGYKVRMRTAVASGDPVGERASWNAAIDTFVSHAQERGLRLAVLGAGEQTVQAWRRHGLSSLAIGRDVVVHCSEFSSSGRRFRNWRQAIQRSRNAGVTVEIRREGGLRAAEIFALRELMHRTSKHDTRGFSMILGRLFDGAQPDAVIGLAHAADGTIVGAHRYLWAGKRDLSLDLPIRSHDAPNGVDERIIAEVVEWGEQQGVERVSLAFAPFPDLFANRAALSVTGKIGYALAHLLDPLIRVERLYRYLRKFHAFDQQRFVMLRWRQLVPVLLALLLLEFGG